MSDDNAAHQKPSLVRLQDLPSPPDGNVGWPWTEEPEPLPDRMPDGRPWPRITIVTPSFNQREYLEETLRSVLLQGYPNLEYILIDGGSTDGSPALIRRYAQWLSHWVSEPDRGQSDAINKGFRSATGEIFAWLNSDDIYYPGVLARVALAMERRSCDLFLGAMDKVEIRGGRPVHLKRSSPHAGLSLHPYPIFARDGRCDFHFIQPPLFWRRWVWESTEGLDERYHYVMDLEWCTRALAAGARVRTSDDVVARFTVHESAKTQARLDRAMWERARMYLRLARQTEYRTVGCLLSSLVPIQRAFAIAADRARAQGAGGKAAALALGARAARYARRTVGGGLQRASADVGAPPPTSDLSKSEASTAEAART